MHASTCASGREWRGARSHMFDLIETTRLQHYEEYRTDAISAKKEKKAAKKSTSDKPAKVKA